VGDAVEIEELRGGRVFLRLCRVLLELDLFDPDTDMVAIFRRDSIMFVQVDVTVPRKGFYQVSTDRRC